MAKTLRKASTAQLAILAANIRALRHSARMSQEELADRCSLHRTYIGSIERGERNLTLATLEIIAKGLGVTIPELLANPKRSGRSTPPRSGV